MVRELAGQLYHPRESIVPDTIADPVHENQSSPTRFPIATRFPIENQSSPTRFHNQKLQGNLRLACPTTSLPAGPPSLRTQGTPVMAWDWIKRKFNKGVPDQ